MRYHSLLPYYFHSIEDKTIRQYEPIWLQLKSTGTATLVAPVSIHQRIIQAVRKERSNDRGWKALTYEAKRTYVLEITKTIPDRAEVGTLAFKLVGRPNELWITLADL